MSIRDKLIIALILVGIAFAGAGLPKPIDIVVIIFAGVMLGSVIGAIISDLVWPSL